MDSEDAANAPWAPCVLGTLCTSLFLEQHSERLELNEIQLGAEKRLTSFAIISAKLRHISSVTGTTKLTVALQYFLISLSYTVSIAN